MARFPLILIMCLLFAAQSFAQSNTKATLSGPQLSEELAKKRARQREIDKRRADVASELVALKKQAEGTAAELATKTAKADSHDGGWIGRNILGAKGEHQANEELKKARENHQAIVSQIAKLDGENTALGTELSNLGNTITKSEKELAKPDRQLEIVNLRLENILAQADIQKMRAGSAEADATLNKVEATMAQTAIGFFVRDKIGQLVNSDLFCKAQTRCKVSEPKKLDSNLIDEVFPEMKGVHRTDYYKKVDANREQIGLKKRTAD